MLFILILHQCEGRIDQLYLTVLVCFGGGNISTALQDGRFAPIYLSDILHSRIIKVEDQDIFCSYADELIHHIGHLGPLYHRADSDPFGVF
jgi:hypothetical protein